MLLTPIAIVAGVILGLIRGGQPDNLRQMGLRWTPLLILGLMAQTIGDQVSGGGGATVLMLGSFLLIVALGRNLHLKGMTIVSIGLLLNLTVLVFNGHIPTRFSALEAAGKISADVTPEEISRIGQVGELETGKTTLAILGDIIPISFFDEVVSFGDLIMVSGLFVLFMNLLLLPRRVGVSIEEILDEDGAVLAVNPIDQGSIDPGSIDPGLSVDSLDPDDSIERVIVLPRTPDIDLTDPPPPPAPSTPRVEPLEPHVRPSFEAALRVSSPEPESDPTTSNGD